MATIKCPKCKKGKIWVALKGPDFKRGQWLVKTCNKCWGTGVITKR